VYFPFWGFFGEKNHYESLYAAPKEQRRALQMLELIEEDEEMEESEPPEAPAAEPEAPEVAPEHGVLSWGEKFIQLS